MSSFTVNENASVHSQQYVYRYTSHNSEMKKKTSISDRMDFSDSSNYSSHLDRLFQKIKMNHTYIAPPPRELVIEKRLFLLDIIQDMVNLDSYWESSLKKLDNLPKDISTKEMRQLFELMANLSQISRDIAKKRCQLQKG